MILAVNLLTDAFSTSHLTDIYKTTHNYNEQQHKNLNNQARTLLTYSQTKANKTTLSQKDPTLKQYSAKKYGLILMIFGRNIQKALE